MKKLSAGLISNIGVLLIIITLFKSLCLISLSGQPLQIYVNIVYSYFPQIALILFAIGGYLFHKQTKENRFDEFFEQKEKLTKQYFVVTAILILLDIAIAVYIHFNASSYEDPMLFLASQEVKITNNIHDVIELIGYMSFATIFFRLQKVESNENIKCGEKFISIAFVSKIVYMLILIFVSKNISPHHNELVYKIYNYMLFLLEYYYLFGLFYGWGKIRWATNSETIGEPNLIKNYIAKFDKFDGKTSRKDYWLFVMIKLIITTTCIYLDYRIFDYPISVFTILIVSIYILPTFAIMCRRLHDVDKDGTYIFISLIPIYGQFKLLHALLMPSADKK